VKMRKKLLAELIGAYIWSSLELAL